MKTDVENLVRQGLIEFKSIRREETGSRQVRTLSKNDYRFLTHTQSVGKEHAFYHGFFQPREAHHDADFFRLYQKTAKKINGQRGPNVRAVLDYQLKKHLYRSCRARQRPQFQRWQIGHCRSTVSSRSRGLPCPAFESNTKLAMENGVAWTLNLPPVITAIEISPTKYAQDSRSALTRMMCQSSG
jgi:hypothetical protein